MADAVRYRKLPGRRRGFIRGGSVWLGPDHLLLVKSMRFREEYKRYQLRDIQAIVIARAPRFHISTRSFAIATLWLFAYFVIMFRGSWAHLLMWSIAALVIIVWVLFSWLFSCRCQINTAVSRDDLPSLYRTWTARRFLDQVQPLIVQAQGVLQGPWAEAVEDRNVGPAESVDPIFHGSATAPPPVARTRSLATDLFLAALFADAIWDTATLHAGARWIQVTNNILTLLVLGAAITVIVERYRGFLQPAMQKLAIVTLVVIGLLYYLRPIVIGMMAGIKAAGDKHPANFLITTNFWTQIAEAILTTLLGLIGLVIVLMGRKQGQPGIVTPST